MVIFWTLTEHAMLTKIDYKKELKEFYKPSARKVEFVDVPQMNFLMIDGKGNPKNRAFSDAIEALYSVSYTLKFMIKKGDHELDYGVMPLEGLWWADDMGKFESLDKSDWKWTAMIMQPEFISVDMVMDAIEKVSKKKNPAVLDLMRFCHYSEGKSAQIMHIGPFSEEGPTVAKIHRAISDQGYKLRGKHHEIYLSDIRRADPAKWKTIIRQPFE